MLILTLQFGVRYLINELAILVKFIDVKVYRSEHFIDYIFYRLT